MMAGKKNDKMHEGCNPVEDSEYLTIQWFWKSILTWCYLTEESTWTQDYRIDGLSVSLRSNRELKEPT